MNGFWREALNIQKTGQMNVGGRNERGELFDKLKTRKKEVAGPVSVGSFEPQNDITGRPELQPFFSDGGTGDVAAVPSSLSLALGELNRWDSTG